MRKFSVLIFAFASSAGPVVADAVCKLDLQERAGPHLTATLTKTAESAAIEYDLQAGFLYPFKFDCLPSGTRICVTEKPWSFDAVSFEYPPYAITLSVLDREAYGNAETGTNIRLWRIVDCVGELEFN